MFKRSGRLFGLMYAGISLLLYGSVGLVLECTHWLPVVQVQVYRCALSQRCIIWQSPKANAPALSALATPTHHHLFPPCHFRYPRPYCFTGRMSGLTLSADLDKEKGGSSFHLKNQNHCLSGTGLPGYLGLPEGTCQRYEPVWGETIQTLSSMP